MLSMVGDWFFTWLVDTARQIFALSHFFLLWGQKCPYHGFRENKHTNAIRGTEIWQSLSPATESTRFWWRFMASACSSLLFKLISVQLDYLVGQDFVGHWKPGPGLPVIWSPIMPTFPLPLVRPWANYRLVDQAFQLGVWDRYIQNICDRKPCTAAWLGQAPILAILSAMLVPSPSAWTLT